MIVAPAPISVPVNTANPPTEAASSDVANKPRIPEPTSSSNSSNTRSSNDGAEQSKAGTSLPAESGTSKLKEKESTEQEQQQENRREQQEQNQIRKEVESLRKRDREVRAHEQAHAAAGGQFAGAPKLSYTTGPDGKRYAVAGEVAIDVSPASTAEATIAKMAQIQRAALAPAEPSGQDRRVAAQASQIANDARAELLSESSERSGLGREDTESEENPTTIRDDRLSPSQAADASSRLKQKIAGSGAIDDPEQSRLFSQTA